MRNMLSCNQRKRERIEYERLITDNTKNSNEFNEGNVSQNNDVMNVRVKCGRLNKVSSMDEIFRMKPKKKGSAKNIQLVCDDPSCEAVNVDLIRCNICTKYVCEQCHDVPVGKLKAVMDKCRSIYFICEGCDNNMTDIP